LYFVQVHHVEKVKYMFYAVPIFSYGEPLCRKLMRLYIYTSCKAMTVYRRMEIKLHMNREYFNGSGTSYSFLPSAPTLRFIVSVIQRDVWCKDFRYFWSFVGKTTVNRVGSCEHGNEL